MAKKRVEEGYKGDFGGLRGYKREVERGTKGNGIRRGGGPLGISSQTERLAMGISRGKFIKGHQAQRGFKEDGFSGERHSLKAPKQSNPQLACQEFHRGANKI